MTTDKVIPTFDADFGQLICCPECGSKKFSLKPTKETPEYISKPFAGYLECHGACKKSFMVKVDAQLVDFIKEITSKLLTKNHVPLTEIKTILSKLS